MKKLKDNGRYLLIAIGVVLVWRGVWGLADMYLTPSNPVLSFSLSLIAGILILLLNNKRHDVKELVD